MAIIRRKNHSKLEQEMGFELMSRKIKFVSQYKFADDRKWLFDFAIPEHKIAIECQGGLFMWGRHNRGASLINEYEKINTANVMGWTVLYATDKEGPVQIRIVAQIVSDLIDEKNK